jgi:peptidoglycan hydrolase-like protein with peptidoglycan-binding domain
MSNQKWTFAAAIAVSVFMVMGQTPVSASSAVLRQYAKGNVEKTLQKDLISKSNAIASSLLKKGDKGSSVMSMQEKLIKLGYLHTRATGLFGSATAAAVKKLQRSYGYTDDGIAGKATLELISKLSNNGAAGKPASAVKAATTFTAAEARKSKETIQSDFMPPWFGNVDHKFAIGDTATVYDIESGKSFMVKRTYGHNHADCEALTAGDTAAMKAIFGGSWSWQRRAVIVSVNGLKLAASMSGMPHAGLDRYPANKTVSSRSGGYRRGTNLDSVKNNKMNGVFDIHFNKSRNHYNNRVDKKHQALVKQAANWAEEHYK